MRCNAAPLVILVCAMLLFSAQKTRAILTFAATCTLDTPAVNAPDIHTGGILHTAMVPVSTSNTRVSITGATSSQHFNVQWSMEAELDTQPDISSTDYSTTMTGSITCDTMGEWHHDAHGNGQINGTFNNQSPGTHAGRGYCDFVDNDNSAHNKNVTTASRNVTVVDP